MPAIVVDIDYTICNPIKVDEMTGRELGFKSLREFGEAWKKMSDKEIENALVTWHACLCASDPDPIEGSADALKFLSENGYEIIYLTGRWESVVKDGMRYDVAETTRKWLEKHGFPGGKIHMVGWDRCGEKKRRVLEEISAKVKRPIYGIGDRKSDMIAYLTHGIIPVLFNSHTFHPTHDDEKNLDVDGLIRVSSWNDFLEFMRDSPSRDFVVSGIIIKDGKVLLIRHKQIGKWVLPGGHIERWEDPDAAIIREMKEETGLDVEFVNSPPHWQNLHTPDFMDRHEIHFGHEHIAFVYILKPNGEFSGNDEGDWHWFGKDDLEKGEKDGSPIPKNIIEMCKKALETVK